MIPPTGFVQEQGAWVRHPDNPIIVPTIYWENDGIQEPSVLYEGPGDWKMLARIGWAGSAAIVYLTSTDGVVWDKPLANAVLGYGSGGESADCFYPMYLKVGTDYWCYYVAPSPQGGYHRATSSDGYTFSATTMNITLPSGMPYWGNAYVWQEDGAFKGLFEAGTNPTPILRTFLYTSADGINWTIGNGGAELADLQIAAGGMTGGPWLPPGQKRLGRYQLYYHAAPGSGALPTDIYHATSTDLVNWDVVTPNPIITHLGGSTFEKEQAADACVLEVDGTSWMFYSGVDDTGSHARIGLAQYAGPLTDFIGT
jgi:predicted GH43/DUF377 family glycosyl hydrolase